ncbi:reverse transcriptase domain-containing protein, partial [Tanacetum coccineum]
GRASLRDDWWASLVTTVVVSMSSCCQIPVLNEVIIDWEVYTEDSRKYWKIIRVGNHLTILTAISFIALVQDLDTSNNIRGSLYGDEIRRNPRNYEESHYPNLIRLQPPETEPRRRHGNKSTPEVPSPIASSSETQRNITSFTPGPMLAGERREVYTKVGEKNKAHLHVLHPPPRKKAARKRYRESEEEARSPWTFEERNHYHSSDPHFISPRTRCLVMQDITTKAGIRKPLKALPVGCENRESIVAMANVCQMIKLNVTSTRNARAWFDKLPKESIDRYEDLRAAFRENYLQQTKHIKDLVEIHHIKQRNGESTEDFMERYKAEVLDVEGAPECMKISGFMHGITHPELIKRLYEKIPRSMDEMYRVTTSFLQGEVAAFSHSRKKAPAPWRQPEEGNKPNFKKGFKNKQRSDRKPDRFSLLMKTLKEIFALEKRKFKAPPPMLRKQIDEMIKSGKLSQFIKELKQNDKPKAQKKGETAEKDKPLAILMIQPWERVAKQRGSTQSFSPETTISFPSLGEEDGMEGPMIIEAEIGGHFVHQIYVDGGASSEVLYEHCFVRLRPEIRSQMVSATTSLIGFIRETIWPIGQISLLVKIGDEDHSTSAWMNFMVIRSPSQHNGIIGRTGIRKIRAVPSTAHEMLKFPVKRGTVMIRSSRAIPMECAMISGPSTQHPVTSQVLEEKIKVAIHPEYPEQTITIGSTLTEKGRKELCAVQQTVFREGGEYQKMQLFSRTLGDIALEVELSDKIRALKDMIQDNKGIHTDHQMLIFGGKHSSAICRPFLPYGRRVAISSCILINN